MDPAKLLMAKVCHYYYREHKTQAEIGTRLGISRHKVGRLLKDALASGFVRIDIASPYQDTVELESQLVAQLGLKAAVVVEPIAGTDEQAEKEAVAGAGARFLRDTLRNGDLVGVGWGSTTYELVRQFQPARLDHVGVVQVTGGNKWLSSQFDCQSVTRSLAEKLGVEPVLLHAPGIVDNEETRRVLLRESSIAETFQAFDRLSVAVVGVGALVPAPSSTLLASGYVPASELSTLKRQGAVGDVFSYFIDETGAAVPSAINKRTIAIEIAQIRRIARVIAVAAGEVKARAVLAAIRGGFVNELVTDSRLAKALLEAA